MANIKYRLIVESSGAVKGAESVQKALKDTSTQAKNAQQATDKASKATVDMSQTGAQSLTELSNKFDAMGLPLGRFGRAVQSGDRMMKAKTVSAKALRIALIALPFVAIATAVMVLFKAFTSTQEGADRLNRILVPLRTVMERLWGVVQDLSIAIVDAFKDPQQAVRDLWQLVQDQIMNRLRGFIDMWGAVGRAVQAALRFDFDELGNQAREFGHAYAQTLTGVEDVVGKVRNGWSDINAEMREAIEHGRRIQELEEQIRQTKIDQTVPMARLNREYQELRTLAGDTSRAEQERLANIDEATRKRRRIRDMELELLELEIEKLELQQAQNDTSDEEMLQLQQLMARRDDVAATAERDLRNMTRMRGRVLEQIDLQAQAEVDAQQKASEAEAQRHLMYIEGLEERAEAFREMLLSEEEAQQIRYEQRLEELSELLEQEIISEMEASEIKQAIWHEMYGADIEAKAEAERKKAELDKQAKAQERKREEDLHNARMQMQARAIGEAIAQDIARADSAKEATGLIMQTLLNEILLRAFNNVFAAVPFPFDALIAPVAALAARQSAKALVPGFASGGVVRGGIPIQRDNGDNRIITARTGEVVLNRQQQDLIGSRALASAGVPGISGGNDMSGAIMSLKDDIRSLKFEIDLVSATDKITDQQDTNRKRRTIAV